ncbi:MAG: radical SAM protein [Thermodesulfobacteriota bacterium]|nr:radical SAM protein [Thermodesulfobacteriota bacterium]
MKVFLVNPACLDQRIDDEDSSSVSMGLFYLGAFLKEKNINVRIVNLADGNAPASYFTDLLKKEKPDLVGVSVLNSTRFSAMEAVSQAKEIDPCVKTVFGGVGATFLVNHFFSACPFLDYIVKGEGELTFFELLEYIESGDACFPDHVKGLAFKRDGKICETKKRELIKDLDSLPKPGKYFDLQHLSLSRGCPGNCTFCGSPAFWGRANVRFHSHRWFVDHIELLIKRGFHHFYVSDDTFTMDKKRVSKVCDEIIARGLDITWVAISRVDFLDHEILFKMRMAGCTQISFGVESGSEQIRKILGKPVKKERIIKAFNMTVSHGILTRAYFIYGSPEESEETIAQTMELITSIKPLGALFYMLVLFPGTALYQRLIKRGEINDDIWNEKIEDIPWFQLDNDLDFEKIRDFGERLRNSFYSNLSEFADKIDLMDIKELYPCHADFLSRLAMTFSHGDYARNRDVKNSIATAEKLYNRALSYCHNARAYLGLGMLKQKKREFSKAVTILETGLQYFSEDKDLNICMAVCLMNLGRFKQALNYLEKFESHVDVEPYIKACRERGV